MVTSNMLGVDHNVTMNRLTNFYINIQNRLRKFISKNYSELLKIKVLNKTPYICKHIRE